mmetsp:Transcript_9650/g.16304  ORF Transcript_9650/g.16304 Transcript_9650/m.16304 type:complete len:82 (-) Transcript_9650:294-539(-)
MHVYGALIDAVVYDVCVLLGACGSVCVVVDVCALFVAELVDDDGDMALDVVVPGGGGVGHGVGCGVGCGVGGRGVGADVGH